MRSILIFTCGLSLAACSDVEDGHDHHHHHEHEMITTVRLDFASESGESIVAEFVDLQDGADPTVDDITLVNGESYTLSVYFVNNLEDPEEDITPEIEDEGTEHQVFLYGEAVESEANPSNADALITTSYVDVDDNGLDLGLEHNVATVMGGTSTLNVLLRHMPLENGETVKTATLANDYANGGVSALPGDTDVDVSFTLNVQ